MSDIGIDLGSSFVRCAVALKSGAVEDVLDAGLPIHGNVVFTSEGVQVGNVARSSFGAVQQLITLKDLKRHDHSDIVVSVQNKNYKHEDILVHVLRHVETLCREFLQENPQCDGVLSEFVITVPPCIKCDETKLIHQAAMKAGLGPIAIINENVAAAIFHFHKNFPPTGTNVLVLDLGSGKFSATLLHVQSHEFGILAQGSDHFLGGDDFDKALVQYAIKKFATDHKLMKHEFRLDDRTKRRLEAACRRTKHFLSTAYNFKIVVDSFYQGQDLNINVTREIFVDITARYFEKCMNVVNNVVDSSDLLDGDIHQILLAGGSSKIQGWKELLRTKFNRGKLIQLDKSAVARGAAIQSSQRDFYRIRQLNIIAQEQKRPEPILGINFDSKICYLAFRDPSDMGLVRTLSIPSVVVLDALHQPIYGESAQDLCNGDTENCFYDLHKMIGTNFEDAQICELQALWPFHVTQQSGNILLQTRGRTFSAEKSFRGLISYLKSTAEDNKETKISRAVLAMPVNFNQAQTNALKECFTKEGFTEFHYVREPIAAVMAHYGRTIGKGGHTLVFKWGHKNLEVAICSIVHETIEINASGGHPCLGRKEVVEELMRYCEATFQSQNGVTLVLDDVFNLAGTRRFERLRKNCIYALNRINTKSRRVSLDLESLQDDYDLRCTLTPDSFQSILNVILRKCMQVVLRVMAKAGIGQRDIKSVVLAGTSSKMPGVSQYLQEKFPAAAMLAHPNPACLMAVGATKFSGVLHKPALPVRLTFKSSKEVDGPILGIDFGTSFCCVAVLHDGEVEVLPNYFGAETTPSYIQIPTEEEQNFIVGSVARDTASKYPENTIYHVKRMIDREFSDIRILEFKRNWPFKISSKRGRIKIQTSRRSYFPEELAEKIFFQLKTEAEDRFGDDITKAVLAVPVHFSPEQTQLLRQACLDSGFESIEVVKEPFAAAIAYSESGFSRRNLEEKGHTLIFDLGGGTFDLCICRVGTDFIEVKAVDGHPFLGGDNFDDEMVAYCLKEFNKQYNIDVLETDNYPRKLFRLKKACENTKIDLSQAKNVPVQIEAFCDGNNLIVPFTRTLLNDLIGEYLRTCMAIVHRAIIRANISKKDIAEIVVVGGSSRIPRVRELLTENFPDAEMLLRINPSHAVACGAAKAFSVGMIQI